MSSRRPNKLHTKNIRSFSSTGKFSSKMSENHLSPNSPSSAEKPDLNDLKNELYQKNGVLFIDNKEFRTKMEEFEIVSSLGNGTCGNVYKMKHERLNDFSMAVKQMRPSSHCFEENKRIFRDLYVVTRCQDCPFIVTCYGIFISQSDVWICMEVMETCLDKLLKLVSRPFPEFVIGKVSCAIIKALQYLKTKHNIMHRDIKPSNMLLSNRGEIKLCDFGISAKLKDSIANSRQPGCIGYMAPERLKSSTYDVRADVWSLGMSLVELATGKFPIDGFICEFEIITKIIDGAPPSLPHSLNYSNAFETFVSSCLKKDFNIRPKYNQLMASEFYMRHNVDPLDVLGWYNSIIRASLNNTPSNTTMHVAIPSIHNLILDSTTNTTSSVTTQPTQPSSGYSSACSDSSSGGSPNSNTNNIMCTATKTISIANSTNSSESSHLTTIDTTPSPLLQVKKHRTYVLCLPAFNSSNTTHNNSQNSSASFLQFMPSCSSNRGRRFQFQPSANISQHHQQTSLSTTTRSMSQPPSNVSTSNTKLGRRFLMLETDL